MKINRTKPVLSFLFASFIFLIVYGLSSNFLFFRTLNSSFQNLYYLLKEVVQTTDVSNDIIIAEIDESTLQKLGRFPFDRKEYIPVLNHLKEENVGVIGFDIIFADNTNDKSDIAFSEAIKNSGNIVLGYAINDGKLERPLSIFEEASSNAGYYPPQTHDSIQTVYSIQPYGNFDVGLKEHFSLAVLKTYYSHLLSNVSLNTITPDFLLGTFYEFIKNKVYIPLSSEGKNEILIHYNTSGKFQKVSFYDIYDLKSFNTLKENVDFKDKIVLIGAAAKGIKDVFFTPLGLQYGVYIHANMINTVLQKNYFTYFNQLVEWCIIFLLIILSMHINLNTSGKFLILSNILVLTLFLFIFPGIVLLFTSYILNFPIELWMSGLFSLIVTGMYKYLLEDINKLKLKDALGQYVSKDIAEDILSGSGKVNLEGEKKMITVFFSDIAGFTTISEKLTPEELVMFLREYLKVMSDIIMDARGFINKYEGDAIMALWGVFDGNLSDSSHACLSACTQITQLEILNNKWKKAGKDQIDIRIGLHLGDAIVGNIGSIGKKMEFTALGDTVNLASRLEGVNKIYGTNICVSEDVYEQNNQDFLFRYLDKIRVKGKDNPVDIYELICLFEDAPKELLEKVEAFEGGVVLYMEKKFKEARQVFSKLSKKYSDAPSKAYYKRCSDFIENPPLKKWDGVFVMKEK